MELIITGNLRDEDGELPGAELWRVPFRGWDERHVMVAEYWCWPRRYTVVEMGRTRAGGALKDPEVPPGGLFSIEVEKPVTA